MKPLTAWARCSGIETRPRRMPSTRLPPHRSRRSPRPAAPRAGLAPPFPAGARTAATPAPRPGADRSRRGRRVLPGSRAHSRTVRAMGPSQMIDRVVQRHGTRVGHQVPAGFVSDDAAERGWHANGSALIATDGQVHGLRRHERRAARRGAAGDARGIVRFAHTAFPRISAPASSTRVATVASSSGTKPSNTDDPTIIGTPARKMLSSRATRPRPPVVSCLRGQRIRQPLLRGFPRSAP